MFFTSCIGLEGLLYLLLADFPSQRVALAEYVSTNSTSEEA